MKNLVYFIDENGLNYSDIIRDYWAVDENFNEITFKFTLKVISLKYGFNSVTQLENKVEIHSYAIINDDYWKNFKCGHEIKFRSRKEFNMLCKSKLFCQECLFNEINEKAKNIVLSIEFIIEKKYGFLNNKTDFNLTYMEKIYLHLIFLKCQVNSHGRLKKEYWQDMYNTDRGNENFVIDSLFEKKAIFQIKNDHEILNIIEESNIYFTKNKNMINSILLSKFLKYKYLFKEQNTFFNFHLCNDELNFFFENLKTQIEFYELDCNDVNEIKRFILEQKVQDAYKLISNIQDYIPIPIERSIELDCILAVLVEKYNILVVNYILNFQSEKVASELYSLQIKDNYQYNSSKIFLQKITAYLEYLSLSNKTPYYKRNVGKNWNYKFIEYFVCKFILNEGLSWNIFSVNELCDKWLNSDRVKIKVDD